MWDERYAEPGFAYGSEPNDFLRAHADRFVAGARVLCLAEGEGRNAVFLAARGVQVVAVDLSRVGLDKAEAMARERGVAIETIAADLATFAFEPDSYDGIVSIWAHVPAAVRRRVHAGCVQALRPGGVLVLEAYTPTQVARGTGGPRDPGMCMTATELREELAGLEIELLEERTRAVHEGPYHDGEGDVVQLVARRPARP